jgi:hypothetical protein
MRSDSRRLLYVPWGFAERRSWDFCIRKTTRVVATESLPADTLLRSYDAWDRAQAPI